MQTIPEQRSEFDLIFKDVLIVRAQESSPRRVDLAIRDGRYALIEPEIDPSRAAQVIDAQGLMGFPGLTDAHMHVGIYQPLDADALAESKAAAMGGVTSALTYIRTGQYYLNRGGSYADFYPEVLSLSEGNYHVDYGYHLAPISREHIGELERLAREDGVASFKIFMFYGNHGLHGRSNHQNEFLMIGDDERYDLAHFEFIMRELARINEEDPALGRQLSLSLHCEIGDILTAYTKKVEEEGKLTGLAAYSASRPPHSEGLAIFIASYLANETCFPRINLLHLTSKKAIEAALQMRALFPHISFGLEVTVGHLLLDIDSPAACHAKVNPPIRPREDVERLWSAVLNGDVDWVVSDHACCGREQKVDPNDPDAIFKAKSGFGGTEYLLSGFFSEATKRGMSPNRVAELLCWNPAQRYALPHKGDIAVGYDADLVLFDPTERFTVRWEESPSSQGYTPFEGMELTGRVQETYLRGACVYQRGAFPNLGLGRYLKRPY